MSSRSNAFTRAWSPFGPLQGSVLAASLAVLAFILLTGSPASAACPPQARCNDVWKFVQGNHVKVWWQTQFDAELEPKAEIILRLMENAIWPTLTDFMGREPVSDENIRPSGRNGQDGLFDVVIIDLPQGVAGKTHGYDACHFPQPAYIEIARFQTNSETEIKGHLTHEFMHAIQYAFALPGCAAKHTWLMESTAEWAVDYVFTDLHEPGSAQDYEHENIWRFLATTNVPIEELGGDEFRPYGTYLLPLFIDRTYGATFIRQIWEATEDTDNQLAAIDTALNQQRGWDGIWPNFVLSLWNRPPVEIYKEWDGIEYGAATEGSTGGTNAQLEIGLSGSSDKSTSVPVDVSHLGAQYYHLEFSDPTLRSIWLRNSVAGGPADGSVWLLVKPAGQTTWREPQDITAAAEIQFCQDDPAERVEEIVLIFGNSQWEGMTRLAPGDSTVEASSLGCLGYEGAFTAKGVFRPGQGLEYEESIVARFAVERISTSGRWYQFQAVQPTGVEWTHKGTHGDCTGQGGGSASSVPPLLNIGPWLPASARRLSGIVPAPNEGFFITYRCSSSPQVQMPFGMGLGRPGGSFGLHGNTLSNLPIVLQPDGSLTMSNAFSDSFGSFEWSLELKPIRR